MYRIEIWRYHKLDEWYESDDVSVVLNWYRSEWKYTYDNGGCMVYVFKDNELLSFEEEKKLGFYEDDYYEEEYVEKLKFTVESANRLNDLVVICDYLNKFKWLLPKRIKRIIEKYVD